MFADTVGVPVEVADENRPGSLMGAAVIGAVAAKQFPTMDDAVAAMVRQEHHRHGTRLRVVEPRQELRPFFDALQDRYDRTVAFELRRRQYESKNSGNSETV